MGHLTGGGEIRNLRLTLRFDGTDYHGWQVQENAVTVQQTLQDAIEAVLGERPGVTGCSRTDSGVHADAYVCNFRSGTLIPCSGLLRAINAHLPRDICVTDCRTVPSGFHARYSASGKEYLYRIWNSPVRNPFLSRFTLHVPTPLDEKAMQSAAKGFLGRHDFRAFCASGSSVRDTVRTVSLFEVTREGGLVCLRVRADGFLYNMVRIMAGTLLEVSRGRIGPDAIPAVIASGDRNLAGPTAPAHGLILSKVFYNGREGEN